MTLIKELFDLCMAGNITAMRILLNDNPSMSLDYTSDGRPQHFLCQAVLCDKPGVVELLLSSKNINVNEKTKGGETPLFAACQYGRIAAIRTLLKDPRVDVNQYNNDGQSELATAATSLRIDVVKEMIASGRVWYTYDPEGVTIVKAVQRSKGASLDGRL